MQICFEPRILIGLVPRWNLLHLQCSKIYNNDDPEHLLKCLELQKNYSCRSLPCHRKLWPPEPIELVSDHLAQLTGPDYMYSVVKETKKKVIILHDYVLKKNINWTLDFSAWFTLNDKSAATKLSAFNVNVALCVELPLSPHSIEVVSLLSPWRKNEWLVSRKMHSLHFILHFIFAFFLFSCPSNAQTIIVDKGGNGNFSSVQKAIDSVPPNTNSWTHIYIKSGIYEYFLTWNH